MTHPKLHSTRLYKSDWEEITRLYRTDDIPEDRCWLRAQIGHWPMIDALGDWRPSAYGTKRRLIAKRTTDGIGTLRAGQH
jgi:hypothetical protein